MSKFRTKESVENKIILEDRKKVPENFVRL